MNANQLDKMQIALSIILIILIILQNRGATFSATFGGYGGGESFRSHRGLEKFLTYATIVVATLFATSTLLSLIVAKG
jgi:protein translocase SecG subunit